MSYIIMTIFNIVISYVQKIFIICLVFRGVGRTTKINYLSPSNIPHILNFNYIYNIAFCIYNF